MDTDQKPSNSKGYLIMEYNREDPAITFSCEEYGRKQSGNI
jgi:hypothetical protein